MIKETVIGQEWAKHFKLPLPDNMLPSHKHRQRAFVHQGTLLANAILECIRKYRPDREMSDLKIGILAAVSDVWRCRFTLISANLTIALTLIAALSPICSRRFHKRIRKFLPSSLRCRSPTPSSELNRVGLLMGCRIST
jgi:hypothetical protein